MTISSGVKQSSVGQRPADGVDGLLGTPTRTRSFTRRKEILRSGDAPQAAHLLMAGHTCRFQLLKDGRRQITAILVPGDMCDLEAVIGGRADYGVAALTPCTLGEIPLDRLFDHGAVRSHLLSPLLTRLRRDEAIARERMVSLGRRNAVESLAHLFCELRSRLAEAGLADGNSYELRIKQDDLADALGLTSVHVNRTLNALRKANLITLADGILTMLDRRGLERLAQFDPTYLELQ